MPVWKFGGAPAITYLDVALASDPSSYGSDAGLGYVLPGSISAAVTSFGNDAVLGNTVAVSINANPVSIGADAYLDRACVLSMTASPTSRGTGRMKIHRNLIGAIHGLFTPTSEAEDSVIWWMLTRRFGASVSTWALQLRVPVTRTLSLGSLVPSWAQCQETILRNLEPALGSTCEADAATAAVTRSLTMACDAVTSGANCALEGVRELELAANPVSYADDVTTEINPVPVASSFDPVSEADDLVGIVTRNLPGAFNATSEGDPIAVEVTREWAADFDPICGIDPELEIYPGPLSITRDVSMDADPVSEGIDSALTHLRILYGLFSPASHGETAVNPQVNRNLPGDFSPVSQGAPITVRVPRDLVLDASPVTWADDSDILSEIALGAAFNPVTEAGAAYLATGGFDNTLLMLVAVEAEECSIEVARPIAIDCSLASSAGVGSWDAGLLLSISSGVTSYGTGSSGTVPVQRNVPFVADPVSAGTGGSIIDRPIAISIGITTEADDIPVWMPRNLILDADPESEAEAAIAAVRRKLSLDAQTTSEGAGIAVDLAVNLSARFDSGSGGDDVTIEVTRHLVFDADPVHFGSDSDISQTWSGMEIDETQLWSRNITPPTWISNITPRLTFRRTTP